MSVQSASSIRHVDVGLQWVARRTSSSPIGVILRLDPLLWYVWEHLRAFRCLQTLTVRWKKDGNLSARLGYEYSVFILGPLEELQMDLPRVQTTVQATQRHSNSEPGYNNSKVEVHAELQDYSSEPRKDED